MDAHSTSMRNKDNAPHTTKPNKDIKRRTLNKTLNKENQQCTTKDQHGQTNQIIQ